MSYAPKKDVVKLWLHTYSLRILTGKL